MSIMQVIYVSVHCISEITKLIELWLTLWLKILALALAQVERFNPRPSNRYPITAHVK